MSGTGGGVNISGNSHTHENKVYLDQITTDKENYVYLTQLADATDPETGAPIVQRVTEKAKVGYADKAGMAHDLDEDSPVRQQFLSKLADDVAKGRITFEKGVTALLTSYFKGGAHFGNFVKGLAGAMIDEIGHAEFESITARGYLKVFELIYNRLNALEGTTSFADVGTIEEVADGDNGAQILTMRKRWDGDFTAFQPGDIVYGYVNNLHNGTAAEYYKAWAWIKAVDRAANTLTVVSYPDTEVPAGANHALAPSMIITRWGNNIEANAYTYANKDYSAVIVKRGDNEYANVRQSTFYISCEDGNIVELMGVNKPILEAANYGTVLGKMPAGLLDPATQELVNKDQPYLFARGIIVQDLIRIDYEGKTTRTANYRGVWDAATAASVSDYYRSTAGTYDTVTWNGDLWQCIATGTTDEPSETTGSWVNMTGGREEKELRIWIINPTANIISVRRTEVRPEKVGCTVSLHSSDNSTRIFDSSYDLLLEGAKLVYSLDGLTWYDFVMGSTEPLDLEDGSGAIELENGTASDSILTVGGDDMPTSEIGDRIYFELREADTGKPLAAAQVPVVKDGERAPFQSTVFIRTNTEPAKPTGGTYEAPVPTSTPAWSDAIPEGEAVLWASTRIFDDKLQTEWETPRQMTDTATYDVEFSDIDQDPGTPSTAPTKWYDPVKDKATKDFTKMLWRAERQKKNGTWGDWTIVRIKGEKGDPGEDGQDGQDGAPGIDGRDGLMVYPAGYFDAATTYRATSETAPVVKYGENYYVLKRGATYSAASMPDNRKTPAADVANGGPLSCWQVFDTFNAIFADIIMADFAKLSSAVIYGDWMISQQGERNGAASTDYQYFKDGTFNPNFAVNFRTGEMRLKLGVMANFAKLASAVFYGDWLISQQGTLTTGGTTDFESTQYEHFKDGTFEPNIAINFKTGEMKTRGTFKGFISRSPFIITPQNIDTYAPKRAVPSFMPQSLVWRTLRLDLVGTRVIFRGNFETQHQSIYLPALTSPGQVYTQAEIEEARSYIGNIVIMQNESNTHFSIEGNRGGVMNLPKEGIGQFECKMVPGHMVGETPDYDEYIEWDHLPLSARKPKTT